MKSILIGALSLSLLGGGSALAQPSYPDRDRPGVGDLGPAYDYRPGGPRWSRGDRLPGEYRQDRYVVRDWRNRGLRQPPRGHRWYRYGDGNYFLVNIATGLIFDTVYRDDRDQRWRQGYSRPYTYNDDLYYRECRNESDPGGALIGALIGGLIGNSVGDDGNRAGATIAGVIIGGVIGNAMSKDLDCDDRSYAYRSYYNGFNSGRPGARYGWTNPRTSRRGDVVVDNYYTDRYGFRCANFTQTVYFQGRPRVTRGRACRQPDGAWAVLD